MARKVSPETAAAARAGLARWYDTGKGYLMAVPPDNPPPVDHRPHKALPSHKLAGVCQECLKRRIDWMCEASPWTLRGMKGLDLKDKYRELFNG